MANLLPIQLPVQLPIQLPIQFSTANLTHVVLYQNRLPERSLPRDSLRSFAGKRKQISSNLQDPSSVLYYDQQGCMHGRENKSFFIDIYV